jgi:hypothetical protein
MFYFLLHIYLSVTEHVWRHVCQKIEIQRNISTNKFAKTQGKNIASTYMLQVSPPPWKYAYVLLWDCEIYIGEKQLFRI